MKMKQVLLLVWFTAGCMGVPHPDRPNEASADERFNRLSEEFIAGYLAWRPATGTALGLHEYDGKTTDFSRKSLRQELARLRRFDRQLADLPATSLSPRSLHDYRVLRAAIAGELFQFEDMQTYTRNPMTYAEAVDVNIYIKRNFAPLANRVKSIIAIEKQVPGIMAAARENLEASLPRPYIDTALEVANGSADFLGRELVEALKDVPDKSLLAEFATANNAAIAELRDYVAWLKQEKMPRARDDFALGRRKYQKMLRDGELIPLAPERILDLGFRELRREQQVFAEAAHAIDPNRKPIDVFKEIQAEHPTAESLIPDTRRDLESIRQFLVDHQIVSLPSENRVIVEETPQYARATSFASMDSPGPFETKATEAYYYVTPVEPEWTAQQKNEWLTAFNYYTTDIVSIHEAYPGHFVQFLHEQASSATRVEKIFGSYAFIEGWAHYCEQMMVDEGFGAAPTNGNPAAAHLRAAKYRLAQSDEALLRICRLCVSIKMHCAGMSLDEATRFFEENCYYEPQPAREEAVRGTFDPGYLYYTLGKLQLLKLRHDYQAQEGAAFSLKQFHDVVLRHGCPPVRLLREIMLKDSKQWDELL
ncbi:MAG TPA: DUF885 domain-containing protein [Candidatus Acidoferrales bacterium]|nr:DUF885 domain-containing protein [Candidatus Acidoferrales bacterium]